MCLEFGKQNLVYGLVRTNIAQKCYTCTWSPANRYRHKKVISVCWVKQASNWTDSLYNTPHTFFNLYLVIFSIYSTAKYIFYSLQEKSLSTTISLKMLLNTHKDDILKINVVKKNPSHGNPQQYFLCAMEDGVPRQIADVVKLFMKFRNSYHGIQYHDGLCYIVKSISIIRHLNRCCKTQIIFCSQIFPRFIPAIN